MKQIKAVQIGCGKMSKYIMKYVYDLGGTIIGAFDINETIIGNDIGTIIESDKKGVLIYHISKLEDSLKSNKPDIAIITTESYLNDISELIRICVKNGVNVITSSEECFYAENSNPTLYKELDILAKANGVTIVGCGYQDIFWGNLITTLASGMHNITKIKGSSSYNVEDYGIALAKAHGAGFTLDEFQKIIASSDDISLEERNQLINERNFYPSYMWNTVGWLATKLKLTSTNISSKSVPIIAEDNIYSNTLNMEIIKGNVTGMRAIAILETLEGITIEAECVGKVYTKDDIDKNEWTIYSDADTTITVNNPDTVRLTCANIANRIPDVIDAIPGFIPTCLLNDPTYRINY